MIRSESPSNCDLVLVGPRPARMFLTRVEKDRRFSDLIEPDPGPVIADMIVDEATRAFLGVFYTVAETEIDGWYRASLELLGPKIVQIGPPKRHPVDDLRRPEWMKKWRARTRHLFIQWSHSSSEICLTGQLTEACWLYRRSSSGDLGMAAFAIYGLRDVLDGNGLTWPSQFSVDEVVAL